MKKIILSAVAVAAFAIGGVAQADVIDGIGHTISRIFGIPYDARPSGAPVANVYTDAYGRQYQVDPWGRTIYLGANTQPVYIEQNGRLVPYDSYAMARSYDRDGDGIANQYDRAPDDARYR